MAINYMVAPGIERKNLRSELGELALVIVGIVGQAFMVDNYDILRNRSRRQPLITARQISMALIRNHLKLPLMSIGRIFNHDHTTIIHSCRVVNDLCETDEKYREIYNNLKTLIEQTKLQKL